MLEAEISKGTIQNLNPEGITEVMMKIQCMKVKSESEVALWFLTPSDPMDCSLPGSSVPGILQARTLEWVAISFSNA